jgi:hypothetical protein
LALLGFELGALCLELVDELGCVRAVVRAAKKRHGGQSVQGQKQKGFGGPRSLPKPESSHFNGLALRSG